MKTERNLATALITGITGSGGSYLAEYIVENHPNVKLHGISRWHSTSSNKNLERISREVTIHECDLTDFGSILSVLKNVQPDAIFHLASYANVRTAFDTPLSVLYNNIIISIIFIIFVLCHYYIHYGNYITYYYNTLLT